MTHVVAIVPAYNSAATVGATVTALRLVPDVLDVIVVDDGSRDRTAAVASSAGARVVELARNRGKGGAVAAGVAASGAPEIYLLIDADLGPTAAHAGELLGPVVASQADMTVAVFGTHDRDEAGATPRRGGFGLVKRLAARVLRIETGTAFAEPLSGQRAVRGALLRSLELAEGFGLEIGLTLDATMRGAVIAEVEVPFAHRPTGRDIGGFAHRARIGRHVLRAASARIGGRRLLFHLVAAAIARRPVRFDVKRALSLEALRSSLRKFGQAPLSAVRRRWRRPRSRGG